MKFADLKSIALLMVVFLGASFVGMQGGDLDAGCRYCSNTVKDTCEASSGKVPGQCILGSLQWNCNISASSVNKCRFRIFSSCPQSDHECTGSCSGTMGQNTCSNGSIYGC